MNVINVEPLIGLFFKCISLKESPDISIWDISSVNDISSLFDICSSLESSPDISKWDTG